ncbi:MAG: alpha/beta hydrolase [Acidobacteria bacterium]|nr:alpha/beta hydrolase [Acidobacteriota bacterium]
MGINARDVYMIDLGSGPPLVLVPGIQGRWEWMRPTVRALARELRVITFSLCGEPGSGMVVDRALGFDSFIVQIDGALDRAGVQAASLCGISFGGLIALHYAARRPGRVSRLILCSTPSPRWQPDQRVNRYVRSPRLLSPLFVFSSPVRLAPEICAAFDGWPARLRFALTHTVRVAAAPLSPSRMAERVRLAHAVDFVADCRRVAVPTLVLTGEPPLDRVVPTEGTCDYVTEIEAAEHLVLHRTGHIGVATRPDAFAVAVSRFVRAQRRASDVTRMKVGA